MVINCLGLFTAKVERMQGHINIEIFALIVGMRWIVCIAFSESAANEENVFSRSYCLRIILVYFFVICKPKTVNDNLK